MTGIIGRKLGMTQIFTEDGERIAATVIEAGPCPVTGVRERGRDGYRALQLAFGEVRERRLSKGELGHLKKAGAPPLRKLVEFRGEGDDDSKIGDTITVEAFQPGQRIKVSARSKGKGFQGTIRRHNFHRGPVSHGSHNIRAPGSIGASATPSRVMKGLRMPGQMGSRRVTQRGLELLDVDAERNLLIVRGAVPGPRGGFLEIRTEGTEGTETSAKAQGEAGN
jgi:large subunit ribosomal protein L3